MARIRSFHRARPAHLLAGLTLLTSVGLPLLESPPARAATTTPAAPGAAKGDFNNDGYADIAIGVPLESLTFSMQGAVQIIYGSATGLDAVAAPGHPGSQMLVQPAPYAQELGAFGLALAVGDFNGDGFGDLAVGANGEDIGVGGNNEGTVTVFYGSAKGLVPTSAQRLTEATPTAGNQFGFVLAAGDFNGDRKDDLAVDVLNKVVNGVPGAGAVLVYRGGSTGLVGTNPAQLDADEPGTKGVATKFAQFGSELEVGDVNNDGRSDLAVAAPFDTVKGKLGAGAVHLFFGCSGGPNCTLLNTATDQYISQATDGVQGSPEVDDGFGLALAMGNFGRGPGADLAVGVPNETVNGAAAAGAVQVFYSDGAQLTVAGSQFLNQGNGWIADTAEAGDKFGAVLAAGNLGKGPEAELVIGTTFEDVGAVADAGVVQVVYGSPDGLSRSASQLLTQDSPNVPSAVTAGFGFGKAVAIANFGDSPEGDLAISSRDTVNGFAAAGAVTVLYGSSGRIGNATHVQYWTQDSPGIADTAEAGDLFGGVNGQPGLTG
ncbi:MAG TPA: FG-GAP repeat protein [Acidimicrobiia bacterium]|nr:FG-GAP repeat protein [Acidimicrobiia bacterium]